MWIMLYEIFAFQECDGTPWIIADFDKLNFMKFCFNTVTQCVREFKRQILYVYSMGLAK